MPMCDRGKFQILIQSFHRFRLTADFQGFTRLNLRTRRLGGSPRMWLTGFLKGEDGHEQGKRGERRVFQNLLKIDRLGSRKAAAINVHMKKVRTPNNTEEPQHDERKHRGPDAQAPADQKE